MGREQEAVNRFKELATGTGEWSEQARLRLADLYMAWQEYDKALEWYETLGRSVKSLADRARLFLWEKRAAHIGLALFVLLVMVLTARAVRHGRFWPPSWELVFLLPLAGLLVLLCLAMAPRMIWPVTSMVLSGMLVLYLAGAGLGAGHLSKARLAGLLGLAVAGCSGIVMFLLYEFRLLQSVIHTWVFGVD